MPNLMALETSSPALSVAVQREGASLREASFKGGFSHTENLLPLLDRLLKREKLSLEKIDAFLIGRGPGSFTGLRVGFAALKGFLAVEKKDCFGALSLDTIAYGINLAEGSNLAVCLDAYREKIYFRLYRREKGCWAPQAKVSVASAAELVRALPRETYLAGDALSRYGAALAQSAAGRRIRPLEEKFWFPKASSLIRMFREPGAGKKRWLQKLTRPRDFVPLYFRLPEAEEKKGNYAVRC